jgi:hypothetical protein
MNLFANMFNHQQTVNPQAMVLQRLEQMKNSGQITQAQYNALMENQNDPQRMISTMLQSNMISNEQYSSARERVQSFFGSK